MMVLSRIGTWMHVRTRDAGSWIFRRRRFRPPTLGGLQFSVPEPMFAGTVPAAPGVFAIQVPGSWWRAGRLQPLHFGASMNLYSDLMVVGPDDFVAWLVDQRSGGGLYVSYCVMHGADPEIRLRECTRLRRRYLPDQTHSVDEFLHGQADDPAPGPVQDLKGEAVS